MLAGALAILAVGTVVCWLATDATVLIIGRGIQGLGGGTMASVAYGMVAVGVPNDERRGALGWVSLGAGLGMVMGAPFGGLVAEWLSWRWVFALQIPLFVAAALVMLRAAFDGRATGGASAHWGRSAMLGLGIACLCVAGSLGRERGWLSPEILGLQTAAVGIFGIFFVAECRAGGALFPGEIWAAKRFWPSWG
jgi:predicted MFS family arabinose efflux permease